MASNTPNLQLYKKDPATDGADVFNIETMLNENWDKIDAAGATYAEGIKEAYDKAASAQLQKITLDDGSPKVNITSQETDFLAELTAQGRGMHTFYCVGGAVNAPSKSIRGYAYFTGAGLYGYVFGVDYHNNTWVNYNDGVNWSGWETLVKPSDIRNANLVKNSSAILGLEYWTQTEGTKWSYGSSPNEAVYGYFYLPKGTITGSEILESDEILVASSTPGHVQCEFYTSGTTAGRLYLEVYDPTNSLVLATLEAGLNKGWHRVQTAIPSVGSTGKLKLRLVASDLVGDTRGRLVSRIKYAARMTKDVPYTMEGDIAGLFQYVSDGKGDLETAITGKGGTVSKAGSVATFDELGTGIASISTGKKWASGTFEGGSATLSVTSLDFKPSIVIVRFMESNNSVGSELVYIDTSYTTKASHLNKIKFSAYVSNPSNVFSTTSQTFTIKNTGFSVPKTSTDTGFWIAFE